MNAATASPSTSSNNQDTLLGQLNRYLAIIWCMVFVPAAEREEAFNSVSTLSVGRRGENDGQLCML